MTAGSFDVLPADFPLPTLPPPDDPASIWVWHDQTGERRYGRGTLTQTLSAKGERLDQCAQATAKRAHFLRGRDPEIVTAHIQRIWGFGSGSHGALLSGDIDLVVETSHGDGAVGQSVLRKLVGTHTGGPPYIGSLEYVASKFPFRTPS